MPLDATAETFSLTRSNTFFSRARAALITSVRVFASSSAVCASPAFSRSWSSIGSSSALAAQLKLPSEASNSMRLALPPTARRVSYTWKAFLSLNFLNWPEPTPTGTRGAMKSASVVLTSWATP